MNNGDIVIAWGGRRTATRYLTPPMEVLAQYPPELQPESVMKRRLRWDSGPIVGTVIKNDWKDREDYTIATLGRNPALTQDVTGRLWIGYRIPVLTSQDPMGAHYSANLNTPGGTGYVRTHNIGTTAGMNFWNVSRRGDITDFRGAFPWQWIEQVDVTLAPRAPVAGIIPMFPAVTLAELMARLAAEVEGGDFGLGTSPGGIMNTSWTQHPLTGKLMLRGQGGNVMDDQQVTRWTWNEPEGLGQKWDDAKFTAAGNQIRSSNGQIWAVAGDNWDNEHIERTQPGKALAVDSRGEVWTCAYNPEFGEIPWGVRNSKGLQTVKNDDIQEQAEEAWAIDNKKDWVLKNAEVPADGFFSYETEHLTTPEQWARFREQQERIRERLVAEHYALPTIGQQRPGYMITRSGIHVICWMHGNLTAAETDNGHVPVGLKIAYSGDGGRTFWPLIPERKTYLN